jgi:hypothetical protein
VRPIRSTTAWATPYALALVAQHGRYLLAAEVKCEDNGDAFLFRTSLPHLRGDEYVIELSKETFAFFIPSR